MPCESTFRRTLQNLDADALDDAAGAWGQRRTEPAAGARRMVAVDGKAPRGSGVAGGPGPRLLAALDHVHGAVLGQVDVEAKTNEIPMFATLVDSVGMAGAVVTADAARESRELICCGAQRAPGSALLEQSFAMTGGGDLEI